MVDTNTKVFLLALLILLTLVTYPYSMSPDDSTSQGVNEYLHSYPQQPSHHGDTGSMGGGLVIYNGG